VNNKDLLDEDLEEELDKAFKASEKQKSVFTIMRQEKESEEVKEKRIKSKYKY
jgi:hypothetical protein